MKRFKQKWLLLEDDDCYHILPNPDIEAHGTKQTKNRYQLNWTCACNPKVLSGDSDVILGKPIITHNSFLDEKRINESINKLS